MDNIVNMQANGINQINFNPKKNLNTKREKRNLSFYQTFPNGIIDQSYENNKFE